MRVWDTALLPGPKATHMLACRTMHSGHVSGHWVRPLVPPVHMIACVQSAKPQDHRFESSPGIPPVLGPSRRHSGVDTGRVQAFVRGHLVRRGITEARALYAFGVNLSSATARCGNWLQLAWLTVPGLKNTLYGRPWAMGAVPSVCVDRSVMVQPPHTGRVTCC